MKTSKRTNKAAQAAAIAAIASTMGASLLPVNAEGEENVTKNEDVFVQLQADGSVKEVTVSDQLHSDTGFRNYDDKSNLKDVENLKSLDEVQKTSDGYKWTTDEKDIFYQGKSTDTLPLSVKITYKLDGKEMKAEDLPGKSGHLEMNVAVTNNEYRDYTVNGRQYHVAIPFVTVAGAIMDGSKFKNVTTSSGTVSSDSSHQIAAAVMMPGLEESIDGILDSTAMNSLKSYLIEDVTIEADVTDFEAPQMMLAASTNTEDLKEDIGGTDLNTIWDDLDELQDATNKLVDGTQQLYDGAGQLSDGGQQLASGSSDLKDGAAKVADGATKVSDGASALAGGAKDLYNGTDELNKGLGKAVQNNQTLNDGAAKIADGVLDTANKTLIAKGLLTEDNKLTWKNYGDKLGKLSNVTDEMRQQAENTIKSELVNTIVSQKTAAAEKAGQSVDANTKEAWTKEAQADANQYTDTLIYMTAVAEKQSGSSDFEKDMAEQGARLLAAQAVQTTAAEAAQVTLDDDDVKSLLEEVRQGQLHNIPDADDAGIQTAYQGVLTQMNQTLAADPSMTALLTNAAAMSYKDASAIEGALFANAANKLAEAKKDVTVNAITAQIRTDGTQMGSLMQSDPAAAKQRLTGILFKYADPTKDAVTKNVLNGLYKQGYAERVNNADYQTLYAGLTQQVEANGTDETTAHLVINYTAKKNGHSAAYDLTKALAASAAELTSANEVKNEIAQASTDEGKQLITGVKNTLVKKDDSYKEISDLNENLNGIASFVEGLKTYTAGIESAYNGSAKLKAGAEKLSDGADTLADGAASLKDGAVQLSAGAATLKDGADSLSSGINTLRDGAKDLMDGMEKYNDEGISKLTGSDKIADMKNADQLLTKMKQDSDNYDNYSGISGDASGKVKFVFKVNQVKQEKAKSSSSDDTADVTKSKDQSNFFQKLINLFIFWKK